MGMIVPRPFPGAKPPFSWTCPYCGRATTIGKANYSEQLHQFDHDNKDHTLNLQTTVVVCPSPDCKEYEIFGTLHSLHDKRQLMSWNMRPRSSAMELPDYVPAPIREDYEEACLIRDLSPKASATLSRRCLQGIIRDFWGVSKNRLFDEINAIAEKVDPLTWKAIDTVRQIGNIGAHMEKEIDVIVEVEPTEAQLLIGLIETLIRDWYMARHERQEHLEQLISVGKEKASERKTRVETESPPADSD